MHMIATKAFYHKDKLMDNNTTFAFLNLFCIVLLNFIYHYVAVFLTDLECARTKSKYDRSLIMKIFGFQFISYYTPIIYIAFFKDNFVGYPGHWNRLFGLRQETCTEDGCLKSLNAYLTIFIVFDRIIGNLLKLSMALIVQGLSNGCKFLQRKKNDESLIKNSQWTEDYTLKTWSNNNEIESYQLNVTHFGFMTLFGVVHPLVVFYAVLENSILIHYDAKKMLKVYRRPNPKRVKDIGAYNSIMEALCLLSIFTNVSKPITSI